MSTTTTTPQSVQPTFTPISYEDPHHDTLPRLQTDALSTKSSHPSSPESRPVDPTSPIPEEEEDETSSEAANEPVTPTDEHHPPSFPGKTDGAVNHDTSRPLTPGQAPLILNTAATPPSSAGPTGPSPQAVQSPKTPLQKRPTSSSTSAKESGIKRAMSGFFRRSNSQNGNLGIQALSPTNGAAAADNGSDPMLGREHRRMSIRRMSTNTSPYTTRSNSPPSPGSPTTEKQLHLTVEEPPAEEFFNKNKTRSSTGLSLKNRFNRHKITFGSHEKDAKSPRHRSSSVDLDAPVAANGPPVHSLSRQPWGLAAADGVGLKARRMSLSLPDDFTVDVVDLYTEYTDQSKIVGRRGKSLGTGATASVRLMARKGGCAGELYAVKEFRGKSTAEQAEDYEKKVKSEYSIAKSVHHPNIVETFRLCTHKGRWNHVMEFCEQGDLFQLVNAKYLSKEDHLNDRLCLFKQLVQGLNYLHCNGIAHRDIKLENLLITKESKLKITDFGVSEVFAGIHPGLREAGGQCGKQMDEIRLCAPGICGSPPYIAPEVLGKKSPYDPRPLDVWSAAIVMLCMTAGGQLWEKAEVGSSPQFDDLVRGWTKWNTKHSAPSNTTDCPSITESDYPHVGFFDQFIKPPALRRVLLTMLNPDPARRVTISEVAKNRWMKNVECCQIDSYDDPTTTIDASKAKGCFKKGLTKVVQHNHLAPAVHHGHKLVRLPGSTDMW